MSGAQQLAKIKELYDAENCPRGDGGRLRIIDGGREYETDPRELLPHRYRFECPVCGKHWHPIELKRKDR